MERVKIFVQKIQELYYSKHPKSAIDIDLMLDYTRVMYIDLLEWRKEFTEPVHSDIAAMMQENPKATDEKETITQTPKEEQETKQEHVATDKNESEQNVEATNETAAINTTHESGSSTEAVEDNFIPEEKNMEEETELVHDFPEEENITTLSQEYSGISFEAPTPAEKVIEIEDVLVEEAPVETVAPIETPAPTPAEIPLPEFKPYEPAKLFDNIVEAKDIRTSIGINDKYLFLNELFNNHKSDYEETLDKLNRIKTLSEAMDLIKTKVAAAAQWDKNDSTVQSFYALLGKHFSAK